MVGEKNTYLCIIHDYFFAEKGTFGLNRKPNLMGRKKGLIKALNPVSLLQCNLFELKLTQNQKADFY